MRRSYWQAGAVACAICGGLSSVFAGRVIVSGDVTPVFALNNTANGSIVAGNQQFFKNVLGTGSDVLVLGSTFNSLAVTNVKDFYTGLPGVNTTVFSGTVGP